MAEIDRYPRPAIAVDIIVLYWDGSALNVPLIQRGGEPFKGMWALPGGFLELDETLEEAARRELREETALECDVLLRGPVFDAVHRDPRGRVIGVPHVALVSLDGAQPRHGSDASGAELFPVRSLPEDLAFDHAEVLATIRRFAAGEIEQGRLGGEFDEESRRSMIQALLEGEHVGKADS